MSLQCLLIDAGNTRLKWVVVDAGKWRNQGQSDYADWSGLTALLIPGMSCFIASVTAPERERQLADLLFAAGVEPIWLTAEAADAGVRNSYVSPKELGVDRWAGLIAARQRTQAPVLVVSAGTAMTVDAMSAEGEFLGGIIVPGAMLMRQALQRGTARVPVAPGTWQSFPKCTADGVHTGIVAALCGAIVQQHARLTEQVQAMPACVVTGGDAGMLSPHLPWPADVVPALVLEGIGCMARKRGAI